jgi:hypothetical protein
MPRPVIVAPVYIPHPVVVAPPIVVDPGVQPAPVGAPIIVESHHSDWALVSYVFLFLLLALIFGGGGYCVYLWDPFDYWLVDEYYL